MSQPLEVVCAILRNAAGEILVCQRNSKTSQAGKWEFPGGKIEPNETPSQALQREIDEELGIQITVGLPLPAILHDYPDFSIALHPYFCTITAGQQPIALEHAQIRWSTLNAAKQLDWSDADLSIIEHIQSI